VLILTATSFGFYFYLTAGLMSDGPYLVASIGALLCFEAGLRSRKPYYKWAASVAVGVCIAVLLLLRSIGITFVAGLALWMIWPMISARRVTQELWQRTTFWAPALVIPTAVFLAWSVWSSHNRVTHYAGDYMQTYGGQILKSDPHRIDSPDISLLTLPARSIQVLGDRMESAAKLAWNTPTLALTWNNPLALLLFIVAALGFTASVVQGPTLLDCYMFAYGVMLVLYPFSEGTRYVFAIQPFVVLYAIDGLAVVRKRCSSVTATPFWLAFAVLCGVVALYVGGAGLARAGRLSRNDVFSLVVWLLLAGVSVVAFVAVRNRPARAVSWTRSGLGLAQVGLFSVIVAAGLWQVSRQAQRQLHPDPNGFEQSATVQASKWIVEHTGQEDVVMADQDAVLHRLTNRKTFRFPLLVDPGMLQEQIAGDRVAFVVVLKEQEYEYYRPSTESRFEELKRRYPDLFVPVYTLGTGTIYKVRKEGRAASLTLP
jgi:hypothetical protein